MKRHFTVGKHKSIPKELKLPINKLANGRKVIIGRIFACSHAMPKGFIKQKINGQYQGYFCGGIIEFAIIDK